jgi:hypothetical protein
MQRVEGDRTLAEIAALRREIAELRAEQKLLAEQVQEVARSFRAIATQIGIAGEPYRRENDSREDRQNLPGFA